MQFVTTTPNFAWLVYYRIQWENFRCPKTFGHHCRDVIETEHFSIQWSKNIFPMHRYIDTSPFFHFCHERQILFGCHLSFCVAVHAFLSSAPTQTIPWPLARSIMAARSSKQRLKWWILPNILRKCDSTGRIDAGEVVSMHSRYGNLWRCIDSGRMEDIPNYGCAQFL